MKTYLALGDSYTIGEHVSSHESLPYSLVTTLNRMNYTISNPTIIAKTGWTTGDLTKALQTTSLETSYNLVSLLIGVNNQYQGLPIDEFRMDFKILLNRAISLAGNNPENAMVISIPDWSVSPFAKSFNRADISKQIDAFNRVKKEETLKQGVAFIDITPLSRQALNQSQYIAKDNLHFSAAMYQLWVDAIIQSKFKTL